ncbi:MAG: pilus assembly protein CpaD [Alteromonadaceae bacterium]|nr:pilus assembly protein CpaD [Alteromonadaceae bacterium]
MSHINLLPWREQKRNEQKQQYLAILLGCGLLGVGLMFGLGMYVDSLIENQNQRNQFMQNQISVLDMKIEKIRKIREGKQQIVQRISLIEQLQESRNVVPKVMDELARIVPPGVTFSSLNRTENSIEVIGQSESNNRLAEFMRRVEESRVFIQGELSSIKADTSTSEAISDFKFTFKISPLISPPPLVFEQKEEGQ